MIDTDKYEGHTSDWKWIDINEQDDFYLHSEYGDIINHDTPDGKLAQDAPLLLAEVKRLSEQYTELREALVGDSPNWTHEELIERALEMREPAELEFGEWHTDMGEEE